MNNRKDLSEAVTAAMATMLQKETQNMLHLCITKHDIDIHAPLSTLIPELQKAIVITSTLMDVHTDKEHGAIAHTAIAILGVVFLQALNTDRQFTSVQDFVSYCNAETKPLFINAFEVFHNEA